MRYNVYALGIMAAIISFLGFVVENVWLAITKGYINNRNMNTPFLLGYGLLVIAFYFVLGTPNQMVLPKNLKKRLSRRAKYIFYFLCAFFVVCIAEIILGEIVERLCGIEYWNYENLPFHITKYTSVPTSIAFASIITFFMGVCFEPVMELILQMDMRWMKVLSITLMTVMGVDFFVSFRMMIKRRDYYLKWKIFLRKKRVLN